LSDELSTNRVGLITGGSIVVIFSFGVAVGNFSGADRAAV
jgi:hypothetical protein